MPDELVEIARFEEAPQAHQARIVLEEAGIECSVPDMAMSVWPDGIGGGVPLLVPESEADRAIAILKGTPAEDDVEPEGPDEPAEPA